MIQTIPVKETRERLADLLNQVEVAGSQFVITKFGKPRAMLVPMETSINTKKVKTFGISLAFGAWKDRKDIRDSGKWVAKMRKGWLKRNG